MAIATATLDYYFSEVSTNPDKREKVGMLGTGSLLGDPMGRREIRNWKRRTGPFTSNFDDLVKSLQGRHSRERGSP